MKIYIGGVLDQTTPTSWDGAFTIDHIGGTVISGGLHGEIDEWRKVFTPSQQERAWSLIPSDLAERFGWQV